MGLKTLVREELKIRGLTWDRKAKQAVTNKAEAARLAVRQRGHASILTNKSLNPEAFTMPGSYRK